MCRIFLNKVLAPVRIGWVTLCLLLPHAAMADLLIASFNVRNYLLMNRWHEGQFRIAYPKPEAEKACLRDLILTHRPDILLLQEMGSAEFLHELRGDLRALGLDYPFAHTSSGNLSERTLAVLAKVPPSELLHLFPQSSTPTADEPATPLMRRGIQELLFTHNGQRLRLFHVHIKSRFSRDPDDPQSTQPRLLEINTLLQLANQRSAFAPHELLLLLGDFNAPPEDPVIQSLHAAGWQILPLTDNSGNSWTYQHLRSGTREQIDYVWFRNPDTTRLTPIGLFPDSHDTLCASDHRLLLFHWQTGGRSPSATSTVTQTTVPQ